MKKFSFNKKIAKLFLLILVISGCSPKKSNIIPVVTVQGPSEALELTAVELISISEDVDGSISSYLWTQTSGPIITAASFSNSSLNFLAPNVDSDQVLSFQLSVTDNDGGKSTSDEISIIIKQSLADANPIFDYHIIEEDSQASVFISSLNLEINKDLLTHISFKIQPKEDSIADPIYVRSSIEKLSETNNGIKIPIFGMYSDYINFIELEFLFIDGTRSYFLKEIITEPYNIPFNLKINSPVINSFKPSFSYFYLKSRGFGIHIIDIDGNVRWAANEVIDGKSSIFVNDGFRVFLLDKQYELKLSGNVNSFDITQTGLSNIETHHNVDKGKSGYLIEIDADKLNKSDRIIESILIEIDLNGNTLSEWDFGTIFKEYIEGEGYDSSNFVRDGYDWFHMNSAIYDSSDDTIIASSRENFVVKIGYESKKIIWLLGDETKHWYVNYPPLRELSISSLDLKPIGQHALSLIDGDLLLFNNGQFSFNNPEGTPKGKVLTSSPSARYRINASSLEAEVIWDYDPSIYSDICSSIFIDESIEDGDYLVNYAVVDRLPRGEKPHRTLIRGINENKDMLFEYELSTINCSTSWMSRPIGEITNLDIL